MRNPLATQICSLWLKCSDDEQCRAFANVIAQQLKANPHDVYGLFTNLHCFFEDGEHESHV